MDAASHELGWSRQQALGRLETPERLRSHENRQLWEMVGLDRGERVVDVGAGTGYFAFAAGRVVGRHGRVWAVDVSPELIDLIGERRVRWRLPQVHPVLSRVERIPLATGSADAVLMANLLHGAPPSTLSESARLVRDGGRFVVVDWDKEGTGHGPPLRRRLSPAEASGRLATVGLTTVAHGRLGSDHYVLVATPTGSPVSAFLEESAGRRRGALGRGRASDPFPTGN